MAGKYLFNFFQFQEVVGCVCMLNYWFSSNDGICPDNYNYSGADVQYQEDVGCVCMLNVGSAATTNLRRQPQLLPVQVEGQGSQCRW